MPFGPRYVPVRPAPSRKRRKLSPSSRKETPTARQQRRSNLSCELQNDNASNLVINLDESFLDEREEEQQDSHHNRRVTNRESNVTGGSQSRDQEGVRRSFAILTRTSNGWMYVKCFQRGLRLRSGNRRIKLHTFMHWMYASKILKF